mmetsp:Transcript_11926/g.22078  ORF Transcript_11926/g.22078 Transcript_11926/m.22078 type:complete len:367 (-) Transcript_11926:113-1213(-)|eukprot:CAMPEP_0201925576 /NCGR_PEP_ID=MMETSP0903-20130614/14787_1 /ASSEMBLY_ACC=CAM_ASM_000552 /TAXON_ID=420261 /ORGANISM="Thalassiosira antarctica, Strain CCMP982" /LENGTH=366 /DNA_ID=CAMNT_0048463275 /DNA_START=58 /DNA_END=1158 /DNA_ORIENTATION=+
MVLLQEEALEQERARLEALQQREQNRAKRFMNSKNRSIGIDKGYLDKQIEEKRQLELAQNEDKLAEAENLKHLVRCLDNSEAAAQEAKKRKSLDVKKSLDAQTRQPKNNALSMDGPLDLVNCGPSSLQCFSGEDNAYGTRKKAQQKQVKLWCGEYMLEKNRALDAERKEEQDYAHYVLEQDRIRSELEVAAKRKKDEDARLRQFENMEYARQARERKEEELEADNNARRLESHYLQTCPLLTEDTKLATNVNAEHRFRPDHFKGFQKDQVNQVYKENDAVVEEKRRICAHEADSEANWARYNAEVVTKMSDAEEAKQRMIAEENHVQREILTQQKEELDNRKAEIKKEGIAEIGSEFFTRFGQSCR